MRKVKVVAALLCSLTPALLGGFRIDTAYSVTAGGSLKNEMIRAAAPVTADASIMADTIAMTIRKPAAATTSATTAKTTANTTISTTAETTARTETTTTEEETTTEESGTTTTEPETAATETTTTTTETTTTLPPETTAVTTTMTPITTKPVTQATEAHTEAASVTTAPQTESSTVTTVTTAPPAAARPITDAEYIMICNVVGHEYGANWVSEYDKALVVEVIMNRVNSPLFPNTVYDVLMQKGQFPGLSKLVNQGYFSSQVTESVKKAVDLYFADPSQFRHGYLFYTGDGYRNYFRTKY